MVFKVKRRARRNFEIQRRLQLTTDVDDQQSSVSQYTYNWPYDYFSLIELVKMDQTVQYTSANVLIAEPEPLSDDAEDHGTPDCPDPYTPDPIITAADGRPAPPTFTATGVIETTDISTTKTPTREQRPQRPTTQVVAAAPYIASSTRVDADQVATRRTQLRAANRDLTQKKNIKKR